MKKLILAMGLLIGLSACTRLDWAVRFADDYLMLEADRFFDLTGAQKKETGPEVEKAIQKIRVESFPQAVAILDQIALGLEKSAPTDQQMNEWFSQSRAIFKVALKPFEPIALELSQKLTPDQEKRFQEKFLERLNELREKTNTPEKRMKLDRERFVKSIENWTGGLTSDQKKEVENFVLKFPTPFEKQISHRERLFREFNQTKGDDRQNWIRKFSEDADALRDKAYAEEMKNREVGMKRFLKDFWGKLNADQKEKVLERLKERAADLRRLSKVEE